MRRNTGPAAVEPELSPPSRAGHDCSSLIVIMCTLMLVLCVGVASSARIYDYNDRLVQGNNNYGGVDNSREGRQHFDRRPGPSDGPVDLGPKKSRPYGDRYGVPDRFGSGRPPGGPPPPQPERRGFGDRSNEITDENIYRIRTTIYSNIPTDRQPFYDNTYKYKQNTFNNRNSENNNEYRGAGDRRGASDGEQYPEVNVNQSGGKDARRTNSDKNTQRETDTSIQSSHRTHDEATVKNVQPEKPVASRNVTDGRGIVEESTWVWSPSTDTSTASATTPQDLDNRASFSGDNCPTGQVRIESKCVDKH